MRLACLFFVLTVLAALIRLGDGGAEARSLAARVPDAMFLTSESPEEPPSTPLTEDQISSLEDVSEEALQMDAEPTPRQDPASGARERKPSAREKARPEPPAQPPGFYRPAGPAAAPGRARAPPPRPRPRPSTVRRARTRPRVPGRSAATCAAPLRGAGSSSRWSGNSSRPTRRPGGRPGGG